LPEKKIVLQNCGLVDPRDIESYIARGGFQALQKTLKSMTPEQVITEVKNSGLRGRGGAGFPTGQKWEMTRQSPGEEKYIICNADEGEVGTFKDRYILENDPFSLVEAMAIGGYALGSRKGYIYLRAEYQYLMGLLQQAIDQSAKKGFLDHIKLTIVAGAGAYVCGEESALMESIEGKRGEVRYRPPFPPQRGLFGKPTVINNVETWMNIPRIILHGAEWYNQFGTAKSKGTKVFSVTGDVARPGVYELILGSPLRELIEDIAGAEKVKTIQVGGATGRLLPYSQIDTLLAFENVLGAGAITVYNTERDIIDIVYQTLEFLVEESCGKCTPCRQGTEILVELIDKFRKGTAREKDIQTLKEVSNTMMLTSLCGLGQAAPNPVMDSLQYFGEEYYNRIIKGKVTKL